MGDNKTSQHPLRFTPDEWATLSAAVARAEHTWQGWASAVLLAAATGRAVFDASVVVSHAGRLRPPKPRKFNPAPKPSQVEQYRKAGLL